MKYAIIIPDGCADEPLESLQGRTPLEAANVPAMDAVAARGVVGRSRNVPDDLPAGSDVANLSLLGYNPREYYTGRAPLEAAAQGIELGPRDWAVRCNLVTIEKQVMRSFTAGHIGSEEAAALLRSLQERVGHGRYEFHPGVSYRNILVVRGESQPVPFSVDTRTTPPHDLTDRSVLDDYPRGPGSDMLNQLMSDSLDVFAQHEVNVQRQAAGKLPATNVWLWGLGQIPQLAPFADVYGRRGAMITAVDLLRGLGKLFGWRQIDVPGATGYTDTDYRAKGEYAIRALGDPEIDLVCVHVEATDEASHEGDVTAKVLALEEISRHIVGPVHEALQAQGDYRILVSPDHPTFIRTKTHEHGYVPFAACGTGIVADASQTYDDPTAAASSLAMEEGWNLMAFFLGSAGGT
ncbi:MAG: cofactor-independent phosphoglycerate mutase [Patescibacteria group bacterium]|nr:cofactor-independent phosphoglycerate mutase [Patescibacteria group bacterium]